MASLPLLVSVVSLPILVILVSVGYEFYHFVRYLPILYDRWQVGWIGLSEYPANRILRLVDILRLQGRVLLFLVGTSDMIVPNPSEYQVYARYDR